MPKSSGKTAQATKAKVGSAKAEEKVIPRAERKRSMRPKTKSAKVVGKAKAAPANMIKKKHQLAKRDNPLFTARPRNFGIGNDVQPRRDLTRFVKWPKYIRLQRQKRILLQRLKIPGTINQFNFTADRNTTHNLFKLLAKHRPETKKQKRARLTSEAQALVEEQKKADQEKKDEVKGRKPTKKPKFVKYGLRHVTALVESRKARLVIIAHDVDPLELVLWLPTLCKKKDVPYMIVKGKAALGRIVHKKTAAAVCLTEVKKAHSKDLELLVAKARENYNDKYGDVVKRSGGQIMGAKHLAAKAKLQKQKAKEARSLKAI